MSNKLMYPNDDNPAQPTHEQRIRRLERLVERLYERLDASGATSPKESIK